MKKLICFLFGMGMMSISCAAFIESYQQCQASYTITNEGPVQISTHGGILDGVIIDSASPLGILTIADDWVSTGSRVNYSTIAALSLSIGNSPTQLPQYIHFGVNLSSGLTYTTANNTGGITIIWKNLVQR